MLFKESKNSRAGLLKEYSLPFKIQVVQGI